MCWYWQLNENLSFVQNFIKLEMTRRKWSKPAFTWGNRGRPWNSSVRTQSSVTESQIRHLQNASNYSDTSANEWPCQRIFRLTKIFSLFFGLGWRIWIRLMNVLVDVRANIKQQTWTVGPFQELIFSVCMCVTKKWADITSHRGDPPTRLGCLRSYRNLREITFWLMKISANECDSGMNYLR